MSFASKAALFGAFASAVLAHGTVSGIIADGVYSEGWQLSYYYSIQNGQTYPDTPGWYAEDLDNGFIAPDAYAEADIICHKNAKNSNSSATVAAGGSVDFQWTAWPDSHIGPIFTYVANCGADCGTVDKSTLKWVKIDEAGIDLDTQTWPTTGMIANNNTWTTTVPSTLAAGKYVFRHEIIAMHGAGSENGAQNYPQCSNIEITGSGTDSPEGTLGTALYTSTDPGILFNPYTTLTEYTIPGPALYSGATGTSGGGASGSSSSAPVATSSVPAVSSVFPSATSAPATVASSISTAAPAASTTAAASAGCKKRRHARDVQV